METNKVKVKQSVDAGSAAEYLEALCNGLKKGRVVVERGEEFVVLPVPERLELEVKAKKKNDKAKFSMEISWRVAPAIAVESPMAGAGDGTSPLKSPAKPESNIPAVKPDKPNLPAKAEASGHVCSVCGTTPVESRSAVCRLCDHESPKTTPAAMAGANKSPAAKKPGAKKSAPKKAKPHKASPKKAAAKKAKAKKGAPKKATVKK